MICFTMIERPDKCGSRASILRVMFVCDLIELQPGTIMMLCVRHFVW